MQSPISTTAHFFRPTEVKSVALHLQFKCRHEYQVQYVPLPLYLSCTEGFFFNLTYDYLQLMTKTDNGRKFITKKALAIVNLSSPFMQFPTTADMIGPSSCLFLQSLKVKEITIFLHSKHSAFNRSDYACEIYEQFFK